MKNKKNDLLFKGKIVYLNLFEAINHNMESQNLWLQYDWKNLIAGS